MKLQKIALSFLLLSISSIYAQEDSAIIVPETKVSYLDSIKATFVSHQVATDVDSLWIKELNNEELYDDMTKDIATIDLDQSVDFELPTELLKERLAVMDAKSPFNIEYNPGLENLIKSFLKNRRKSFERLMGLSEYYFPVFEDAFAKQNVPLEIKYLAIVESALNPKAVSRVGATGLWQFMYQTGKQYKLNIDSYVDERSDLLKSSAAAAQYMSNMYKIFGDWDLVLASYNSGPGNVSKAIRRSGGQKNYWNIRKNLPKETAGYVPAFLATMYIMEYHKEHGITPNRAPIKQFETDTIAIKHQMSFQQISDLLNISVDKLKMLNPSYKINVVPNYTNRANYLRLPLDKIAMFTSNEDKIYAYANYVDSKRERYNSKPETVVALNDSDDSSVTYKTITKTKYYRVKSGDTMSEIANRFNVSMSEIKKWNRLRSNTVHRGANLRIISEDRIAVRTKKPKTHEEKAVIESVAEVTPAKTQAVVYESKSEKVSTPKADQKYTWETTYVNKDVTKSYKIKKGDNLGKIADKFNVSLAELKRTNHLKSNVAQVGKTLKFVTNERVAVKTKKYIKQSDVIVPDAQIVYESKKVAAEPIVYEAKKVVSEPIVYEAKQNNTPEPVIVPEKKSPVKPAFKYEKVVSYKDVATSYKVKKGDNLSTIADRNNVSLSELKKWNNIKGNVVAAGKNLKIVKNQKVVTTVKKPIKSTNSDVEETNDSEDYYVVQSGDNLASIAKKYNVTVKELREWNNMPNNIVHLETKLKVTDLIAQNDDATPTETQYSSEIKSVEYVVQNGDNIATIARKNGVSVSDIKIWNNLDNDTIHSGDNLIVAKKLILDKNQKVVQNKNTATNNAVAKQKLYQVRKGDSLFSIAKKYPGISVSDIRKWNGIRGNDVKVGMKLKISG